MKRKTVLLKTLVFSTVPALITIAQYYANVIVLSNHKYLSPTDALAYEGVSFVIVGLLAIIGIGCRKVTEEAAMIAAVAKGAPGGEKTVGPSEIFREYIWNPKGSTGIGLILIFAGVLMILTHFLINVNQYIG